MKMRQTYEQNNALGDPQSVEGQLTENSHKMDKLQTELKKFQSLLADVVDGNRTPSAQKKSHRNSVSEDSLSRSASESSVTNNNNNTNNILNTNSNINSNSNHRSSNSLQSVNSNHNHNNSHNNHIDSTQENNGSVILNSNYSSNFNFHNNLFSDYSPTSELSTSHLSIPDAEFADADGEFEDPLPALGTAKALYPFEGLP